MSVLRSPQSTKPHQLRRLAGAAAIVVATACRAPSTAGGQPAEPAATSTASGSGEAAATQPASGNSRRIVAIGDLHGDLASAREAFVLAGATDTDGHWIGGDLIVVQLGDQTDRGDDEREILDWFGALRAEAAAAGGEFHALLGNHEQKNAQLDLRYVTPGGFTDFADVPCPATATACSTAPDAVRGRVAAFAPGGPYARSLAEHDVVLVLDGTVFVHGGLLPQYAQLGVDALNDGVSAWLRGEADVPAFVEGEDSPVWSRRFAMDTTDADCTTLATTLDLLGAERMVVGHTVQQSGITSACGDRVWRVDVGLADYYGGTTQVLEIVGDDVRVLR
jgi:hypothetical protein